MSDEHMTILCRECGQPFEQTTEGSWRHTCTQGKVSVTVSGDLAERDILPPEALKRMLAKEETPGTAMQPTISYDGSSAPVSVNGGVVEGNGLVIVGEAYGCDIMLPARATVVPLEWSCDGPGCQLQTEMVPMPPDGWTSVHQWAKYANHFCSLRCIANWLAGELAKEEAQHANRSDNQ